jgi:cell wall-associated NlpC family hydrolase
MREWLTDVLAAPYERGGDSPSGFDCWGFVRYAYRMELGFDLPAIIVDTDNWFEVVHALRTHQEKASWEEIERPEDLSVAFFAKRGRMPLHVALYLEADGGMWAHSQQGAGVMVSSAIEMRALGWQHATHYRHKEAMKCAR